MLYLVFIIQCIEHIMHVVRIGSAYSGLRLAIGAFLAAGVWPEFGALFVVGARVVVGAWLAVGA